MGLIFYLGGLISPSTTKLQSISIQATQQLPVVLLGTLQWSRFAPSVFTFCPKLATLSLDWKDDKLWLTHKLKKHKLHSRALQREKRSLSRFAHRFDPLPHLAACKWIGVLFLQAYLEVLLALWSTQSWAPLYNSQGITGTHRNWPQRLAQTWHLSVDCLFLATMPSIWFLHHSLPCSLQFSHWLS